MTAKVGLLWLFRKTTEALHTNSIYMHIDACSLVQCQTIIQRLYWFISNCEGQLASSRYIVPFRKLKARRPSRRIAGRWFIIRFVSKLKAFERPQNWRLERRLSGARA